jgi:hypothetical protein
MGVLSDGGPIYTNGGQGAGGSTLSTLAGNVVSGGGGSDNMLYQDEGSSYFATHDNVVRFASGNWIGMWNKSIHDITVTNNDSDDASYLNSGTNVSFTQATIVTNGIWPPAATSVLSAAGPDPAFRPVASPVDDDDLAIEYVGSWSASGFRGLGDSNDGIHVTQTDGDSAAIGFVGSGAVVLGEENSDQGDVEVLLDGQSQGVFSTATPSRLVQQPIYAVHGLPVGFHAIEVIKESGSFMTLDGFALDRTANDTDPSLAYVGSWGYLNGRGFGDYGDDVHYTQTDGDSVTVTFAGTGARVVTETNNDEGTIAVSIDGVAQAPVNAASAQRAAQQVVYTASGLASGRHTLTLTKAGGAFLVFDRVDAF